VELVVVVEAMVLVVVPVVAVVVEIAVAAAVAPFSPGVSLIAPGATPGVSLLFPGASPGVPVASVRTYPPWCQPFVASSSCEDSSLLIVAGVV
jgi:hypothetical protein